MKYCVKCGNELGDEAVLCTSCGCMAHDSDRVYKKQKVSPKIESQKSIERKIVYVFRFLINILLVTCVTLFIYATMYAYVRVRNINDYTWVSFSLQYECCLLVLIFSSVSFVLSIVGISIHKNKSSSRKVELTFDFIVSIIASLAFLSASICAICN